MHLYEIIRQVWDVRTLKISVSSSWGLCHGVWCISVSQEQNIKKAAVDQPSQTCVLDSGKMPFILSNTTLRAKCFFFKNQLLSRGDLPHSACMFSSGFLWNTLQVIRKRKSPWYLSGIMNSLEKMVGTPCFSPKKKHHVALTQASPCLWTERARAQRFVFRKELHLSTAVPTKMSISA